MMRAAAVAMLAAMLPASVRAQQPAGTPPSELVRTISLSATGTVQREPDQAVIDLAVENLAPTAQRAAQQNAQVMDRVVRALRAAGIPGDHIRTQSYNLNPEYQYTQPGPGRPGEQKLVGYRASNMVEATVDSIPRVGTTIDAAITAGANRAQGIRFQLKDPDAARRDALRLAVANARKDAEALAQASGQQLGELLQLGSNAQVTPPPVPMFAARAMAQDVATTPVEPGQLEVTATVNVVYRLAGPPR